MPFKVVLEVHQRPEEGVEPPVGDLEPLKPVVVRSAGDAHGLVDRRRHGVLKSLGVEPFEPREHLRRDLALPLRARAPARTRAGSEKTITRYTVSV